MAMHNTTKLLPLASQTKLTRTVTLTVTNTVTLVFMHTSLTLIKTFYRIYKMNFLLSCVAGFVGGQFFALPSHCTTR